MKRLWCRLMHDALMWPMHGVVRCGICRCEFPAWQGKLYAERITAREAEWLAPEATR